MDYLLFCFLKLLEIFLVSSREINFVLYNKVDRDSYKSIFTCVALINGCCIVMFGINVF